MRLGEGDADVASGAADIDHGASAIVADGVPGIAFGQEARRQAEPVGECRHGAGEAFGHVWVRGVVLPDGLVGVMRQAPAGLVGFVAPESLPGLDGPGERLPDLVEHVAEPGPGVGVFGELA